MQIQETALNSRVLIAHGAAVKRGDGWEEAEAALSPHERA